MPKLHCWSDLVAEISGIPPEFAVAISTGRPELARQLNRPLTMEETTAVARALIVLLETNGELQKHASEVAVMANNVRRSAKGLLGQLYDLRDKAEFREPIPDEDGQ